MRSFFLFLILIVLSSTAFAQDEQFEVETLQRAAREQIVAVKTAADDRLHDLQNKRSDLKLQCATFRSQYKRAFLFIYDLEQDGTVEWLMSAQEYAPEQVAAIDQEIGRAYNLEGEMKVQALSTGIALNKINYQISILERELSKLADLLPQEIDDQNSTPVVVEEDSFALTDYEFGAEIDSLRVKISAQVLPSSIRNIPFPREFDSCRIK